MTAFKHAPLENLFNRIYSSRWNPLYQSGALALFFFLIVLVTGVYLILFYNVGAPYESVHKLSQQAYLGRWIRTLHRYASDAAMVAVAFHVLKMVTSKRTYGPRVRAWISGWILVAGVLACGWTGFILVWDVQAQWLALEAARLLDFLPVFTVPLPQIFSGEKLPGSFFFSVLFLHVAIPLGLIGLYLVHVSRVARPAHKAPYPIRLHAFLVLLALSLLWPKAMIPKADLAQLQGPTQIDIFYTFWLPLVSQMPSWSVYLSFFLTTIVLCFLVPRLTQPKTPIQASWVDWDSCTGCTTCYQDCPYEAISMVKRTGESAENPRRSEYVALVNPALCVSCGICSGSCAPMGVGPPERTGREQLKTVRAWCQKQTVQGKLVVLNCQSSFPVLDGFMVYPVTCGGAVHTSVLEYLIRKGAAGVYLLTCPGRDCRNREGPKWAVERLFHDREAELHARVDRRRVRTGAYSATELHMVVVELEQFQTDLKKLEEPQSESSPEIELECPEKEIDA